MSTRTTRNLQRDGFCRLDGTVNTTSIHESPRRLLRFRLRTLLLITLLISLPLAWVGWRLREAREQRQVVDWIQKNGGSVLHTQVGVSRIAPRWLRSRLGEDFFRRLNSVELPYAQINDLTPLAEMTEIRSLDLYYASVSDLRPLAGMIKTQHLYIRETKVEDLAPLVRMTNLEVLDLTGTAVSDLTPLAGMARMTHLWLNHTRVSDLLPLIGMQGVTIYLDESQRANIPNELRNRVKRIRVTIAEPR